MAHKAPFGGPGGSRAAPGGLIWAQVPLVGPTGWAASISCARTPYETTTALLGHPKHFHTVCLGGTHPYHVLGPHTKPLRHSWGPQKGPFWPKKALLGALGSPGGLIWAQVPLVGPTGWAASISCARAPYETTTALLGPPKGSVLALIGPFEGPGGPGAAPGCPIWAQVPLVGSTGWAASISCAPTP